MDIKELATGFFTKTPEQQEEVILLATKYYIEDMMVAGGNLFLLKTHLQLLQKRSLQNEDYEVSEVLGSIINGINTVMTEETDGMQL